MTAKVTVSYAYAAPPETVWAINTSFDSFARLMSRVARFDGFPSSGRFEAGEVYDLRVRPFGVLPRFEYRIAMVECDHEHHRFLTEESGGTVKSWRHASTIVPEGDGCRLTDTVEANAGWLTPLLPFAIRFIFRSRHGPRLAMISDVQEGPNASNHLTL